uniref:Spindle assembly abnormal protein 6 N-terminal domain-containing protein n=1 Tax=Graphocephala atropunctata TaxID=36148 RepID=A0A1B6L6U6_9HEMI
MESIIYRECHELKRKDGAATRRTIVVYKYDSSAQVVRLDVLDESDAFFLYCLKITKEDYLAIQKVQNLTTTLEQLPEAVVLLLQRNKEANSKVYMSVDDTKNAVLNVEIREVNSMRDVVLISLQLHKASMSEIQGRVELVIKTNEERIKLLENSEEELTKKLGKSEERVCRLREDLNNMKENYATLQEEHKHALMLHSKHSESEKEKLVQDLTKSHEEKLGRLCSEKVSLQEQLESLKHEKNVLEKDVSILRTRVREDHFKKESDAKHMQEMERDLLTLRSRIKNMTDHMELINRKYQTMTKVVEETKMLLGVSRRSEEQLKSQLSNFSSRNCHLQEIVDEKTSKLECLNFYVTRLQLQIQQKVADLEVANEKIKNSLNNIMYLKVEQRALSWKVEESRRRELALKQETSELQKQTTATIEGLQKEVEQLKLEKTASKSLEDKLSNLKKLLDAKDSEIGCLKKEINRKTLRDKGETVGTVPYLYNHFLQQSSHPATYGENLRPSLNITAGETNARLSKPDENLEPNHGETVRHPLSSVADKSNTRLGIPERSLSNVANSQDPTNTLPERPKPQQSKSSMPPVQRGITRKK